MQADPPCTLPPRFRDQYAGLFLHFNTLLVPLHHTLLVLLHHIYVRAVFVGSNTQNAEFSQRAGLALCNGSAGNYQITNC